jgi:hypothetical protein
MKILPAAHLVVGAERSKKEADIIVLLLAAMLKFRVGWL